jgi:uncharacterized protein YihD (DUF1040 family)
MQDLNIETVAFENLDDNNIKELIEENEKQIDMEELRKLTELSQKFSQELFDIDQMLMSVPDDVLVFLKPELQKMLPNLRDSYQKDIDTDVLRGTALKFDIDKVINRIFGVEFWDDFNQPDLKVFEK